MALPPSTPPPRAPTAAAAVALRAAPAVFVVLWSTGFIGARLGLPHAEPFTFLFIRFAMVTVLLLAAALLLCAILIGPVLYPTWFRSSQVAADERVVFYPTVACLTADGAAWQVPVHGCIFEPETDDALRRGFVMALQTALGLEPEEASSAILARRVRPFLVDNERGKALVVRIAGAEFQLPPSGRNGHFEDLLLLPAAQVAETDRDGHLPVGAVIGADDPRQFTGEVHLLPAEGLSVISDIDDTVKISGVTDKKELLRNTFLEEFRAVPGMAEVYRRWAADGARFHFVSASPWQLYEELAAFLRDAGFPPASFHLKTVRFKDASLLDLFADPLKGKVAAIEPLLLGFPRRAFVLVGDSGEKDPEVYGTLARAYPDQVRHVWIRNVTREEPDSARMQEAFAGIPGSKWTLFVDPTVMTFR